ncbi:MAG: four helix bundle protein [Dehalococcoidia bacterium]
MSNPPSGITSFEDLIAWQKARVLAATVNELAEKPPIVNRFGFRDQIQRAAVSTMSNIAEGFDRGSRAEFHHMLSIAKGSCAEVRSLLYVALDANYIDEPTFQRTSQQTLEVSRLIGGLRASVGRQRDEDRARK